MLGTPLYLDAFHKWDAYFDWEPWREVVAAINESYNFIEYIFLDIFQKKNSHMKLINGEILLQISEEKKPVIFMKVGRSEVGAAAARISRYEGMEAHARTGDVRLRKYGYSN